MNLSLGTMQPAAFAAAARGVRTSSRPARRPDQGHRRFDIALENEFTTFAIPYIVGQTKRFFRDTTWSVHDPRRLQELRGHSSGGDPRERVRNLPSRRWVAANC
ncbi:hypothetical protein [Streptomyces decoyicus]|uniref:hypothetical protein n=1 Tax=Streptomyces decoyicus TaxID=249567 RepID=UPI003F4D458B